MHIIHIIIGLNTGGAEKMLLRLVKAHSNSNITHQIISLTDIGDVGEEMKDLGFDVKSLGLTGYKNILKVSFMLFTILRESRPDIVQTWMYHADLIGGVVAKISGVENIIWGIRSSDITQGGSRLTIFLRWVCSKLSYFIPKLIICAGDNSRITHESLGYKSSIMRSIPNGFDVKIFLNQNDSYHINRKLLNYAHEDIVIGWVGRFNHIKGPDIFIKTANMLSEKFNNLKFLIIGNEMTKGNSKISDLIENEHSNKFNFLGQRQDMPELFSAMDIFCLSSRSEGFPNALGEAMLMKKACVATDAGDSRLLLDETGIIVKKNSIDSLFYGLNQMICLNEKKRLELGQKAHNRIVENYNLEKCINRFNEIYKEVTDFNTSL